MNCIKKVIHSILLHNRVFINNIIKLNNYKELDYSLVYSKPVTIHYDKNGEPDENIEYFNNWFKANSHRVIDIVTINESENSKEIIVHYFAYKGEN